MTEHSPFETSPDAQAWRLSRREAAVNERELQVASREKELGSRDAARQRAEAALESEKQRTLELEGQLEVLEGQLEVLKARVAELESALVERTASLRRTKDEAEGLRTSLERMSERQREPAVRSMPAASVGRDPVALRPGAASAAAQRWTPIEAGPARRRRA